MIKNIERFVGGQLEVQNEDERYLYRGEIEYLIEENYELYIQLKWNAKAEGFPNMTGRWVIDKSLDSLEYLVSFRIYNLSEIGNGRICLYCKGNHELAVLFPKGGSRLDPKKIEGIEGFVGGGAQ